MEGQPTRNVESEAANPVFLQQILFLYLSFFVSTA